MIEFLTNWNYALAMFVVAQFFDIWTTEKAIASGAVEKNRIITWMMDHLSANVWIIVKMTIALVAVVLILTHGTIWLLHGLTAMILIIGICNLRYVNWGAKR